MIMNYVCQCIFYPPSAQIPALAPLSVMCHKNLSHSLLDVTLIKPTSLKHTSKYSPHTSTHHIREGKGFGREGLHRVGKRNWCLKLSHYHHSYVHESTCQSRRIIRAALGPETLRVNWEQDNRCQNMVESRSERLKEWKWNTGVQTILSWIKGLTLVLFYLTCRGEWGKMWFFLFFLFF